MISVARYKKPRSRTNRTSLALLLLFLLSWAGCLGESSVDPPNLPPGVTNISKTAAVSLAPSADSVGNTVFVVWGEGINAVNDEIFLVRSDNGGASFSAPINVSRSSDFSGNPKIALSHDGTSNIIHVVWEELISNPISGDLEFDIFYSRAVEGPGGSLNFEPPQNLSISDPVCGPPSGGLPCPSQFPTIATYNNHVFVAWMESTAYVPPDAGNEGSTFLLFNSDILMFSSSNHGDTFPDPNLVSPEILSLPNTGFSTDQSPSKNPSIAAADGHLFIAWEDTPPLTGILPKVLFRSLDIASTVFTPSIASPGLPLSDQTDLTGEPVIVNSNLPEIAAGGNKVYLIWEGTDPLEPDSEIFLRQAGDIDTGPPFSFSAASNISNNTGRSQKGRVALSGQNISISWDDASAGPSVLFRSSIDGGGTFGTTQTLISSSSTIGNSTILFTDNALLSFWEDALFGKFDIFSARQ